MRNHTHLSASAGMFSTETAVIQEGVEMLKIEIRPRGYTPHLAQEHIGI